MHQWMCRREETEQNLIARSYKSKAEVTSNRRLHSMYYTIEANCWQTRSIARPLFNSWATCCSMCYVVACVMLAGTMFVFSHLWSTNDVRCSLISCKFGTRKTVWQCYHVVNMVRHCMLSHFVIVYYVSVTDRQTDRQTDWPQHIRSLIGDSCSHWERVDNSTSSWVELRQRSVYSDTDATQLNVELSTRSQREQQSVNKCSDPVDSVCRSWRHKQKHDWLGCTLFNWVSWVQLSWVELCRYKHPFTLLPGRWRHYL